MSGNSPGRAASEVLAAIDKFESDLGFTAPELIPDRIEQLRGMIRGIFEEAETATPPVIINYDGALTEEQAEKIRKALYAAMKPDAIRYHAEVAADRAIVRGECEELRERLEITEQENIDLGVLVADTLALVAVLADGNPAAQRQANDLRKRAGLKPSPVDPQPVQPAPELAAAMAEAREPRELLAEVRQRLENLAVGLEASAEGTSPSRKSEIERGCAKAVREIAERPF